MNRFSHFSSAPLKYISNIFLLRGALAASAAWTSRLIPPPPSSHLTLHLSRQRPVPSRHQSAGPSWHRATQLWTLYVTLRQPLPAPHGTESATYASHTHARTVSLTQRPRITFVKASAALLPHRHTHYKWDKEMRTTMIKTENSLSGCQCWN